MQSQTRIIIMLKISGNSEKNGDGRNLFSIGRLKRSPDTVRPFKLQFEGHEGPAPKKKKEGVSSGRKDNMCTVPGRGDRIWQC